MKRGGLGLWLAVGWIGFAVLPWNAIGGTGLLGFRWVAAYPLGIREAPGLVQLIVHGRLWLLPIGLAMLLPIAVLGGAGGRRRASSLLIVAGLLGLAALLAIAFALDLNGWTWPALAAVFGPLSGRQPGLGYGAAAVAAASLMFFCHGVALRGWAKGDTFVASAIGASVALVTLFTLYPIARLFVRAWLDRDGHLSLAAFAARLVSSRIWASAAWSSIRCSSV
jgi:iron(III) transport system permease protein